MWFINVINIFVKIKVQVNSKRLFIKIKAYQRPIFTLSIVFDFWTTTDSYSI